MESQLRDGWVVRERKTKFVDILRTTPTDTVCPNFYVLTHANGCAFSPGCSYCFLKSSLWSLAGPHVFSNVEKMVKEVKGWIAREELESYMLNMGNLSDSLAFEESRPLVAELVEVFREEAQAKARKHTLLLVTKGGERECRPLYGVEPCGNVIVSFSVNSRQAARRHEKGAAPVTERVKAAAELKGRGWRIRMRIDPMIMGFDYGWIIGEVKGLAPERVTLGTLRAEPNLFRHIGDGLLKDLEAPAREGGLARYPKERRVGMYREAVRELLAVCPVALCEETPDVWDALGLDKDAKPCNCGC